MKTYLLKITPLEPYTFGTDQRFKYNGEEGTGKESFYINSNELPEQTTVLGMLRFLILEHAKDFSIKSDFTYTKQEKERMKELIGSKSFQFESKEVQDFGIIEKISPIFIMKEDHYYIKNPGHHLVDENGQSNGFFEMNKDKIKRTSNGSIALPNNYEVKKAVNTDFIALDETHSAAKDLFTHTYITGNKKTEEMKEKNESFFKREIIRLNPDYNFALFLTVKDDYKFPSQAIGYMGLKRSAFKIEAFEKEDDLAERVQKSFPLQPNKDKWIYALSDLYNGVSEKGVQQSYDTFCAVTQKQMRNLETCVEDNATEQVEKKEKQNNSKRKYSIPLKLRDTKVNLIERGSVFYEHHNLELDNENCKKIGYNILVELGGN